MIVYCIIVVKPMSESERERENFSLTKQEIMLKKNNNYHRKENICVYVYLA